MDTGGVTDGVLPLDGDLSETINRIFNNDNTCDETITFLSFAQNEG